MQIARKKELSKLIIIQLAIILVCLFVFTFVHSSYITKYMPKCFWQENFGIICPGCGSTRCIINLFTGNFKEAFFSHPFLFMFIVYFVLLDIIYIINTLAKKKYFHWFYPKWWYVIIYFVLWVIYTISLNF